MADNLDDFDDPNMTEMLRGWGKEVGGSADNGADEAGPHVSRPLRNLFEPPADMSPLHQAMDEVDAEFAAPSRADVLPFAGAPWLRRGFALAASLMVALGAWWLVDSMRKGDVSRGRRVAMVLDEPHLSTSPVRLRGEGERTFRSGDRLYLHTATDRPAMIALAMLDSHGRFMLIGEPERRSPGPNVFGEITLDTHRGTESLVLLATEASAGPVDFSAIVTEAGRRAEGESQVHADRLRSIVEALRSNEDLSVAVCTFDHR